MNAKETYKFWLEDSCFDEETKWELAPWFCERQFSVLQV